MTKSPRSLPPLAKLIIDLGPLVLFFVVNARADDFFTATAVFMVATIIALTVTYAVERQLAPMPLVTGVFVLIFGGLTLLLEDELFIMVKPTIVNLLFAGVLLAGLAMGRPLMKFLFQDAFHLTDEGWRKLTIRWAGFFVFLAVLNEVVRLNFDKDFWLTFKLWGNVPLTILFGLLQIPLLTSHQPEPEKDQT